MYMLTLRNELLSRLLHKQANHLFVPKDLVDVQCDNGIKSKTSFVDTSQIEGTITTLI